MEVLYYGEFGYELQCVIPYAHYLHVNNKLKKTVSSKLTKQLYYFSNNHEERYNTRNCTCKVPGRNKTPHVHEFDYTEYIPPPYKKIFKNDIFVFEKPLLIIHNKFNSEWRKPPINFLDVNTLTEIFKTLNNKYTIVYIRPKNKHIVNDNSATYNLHDYELLGKYNIIDGNELYEQTKEKHNIENFNHFQLMLHSNCEHFISVQGGNCVLASYFGGTNIIFARAGAELSCNAYNGHYKRYSNCNVLHHNNYKDLLTCIKSNYQ